MHKLFFFYFDIDDNLCCRFIIPIMWIAQLVCFHFGRNCEQLELMACISIDKSVSAILNPFDFLRIRGEKPNCITYYRVNNMQSVWCAMRNGVFLEFVHCTNSNNGILMAFVCGKCVSVSTQYWNGVYLTVPVLIIKYAIFDFVLLRSVPFDSISTELSRLSHNRHVNPLELFIDNLCIVF